MISHVISVRRLTSLICDKANGKPIVIMDVTIREIRSDEIKTVSDLECDCYPEDEAASYDQLEYRRLEAGDLMLGCFLADLLIGFICATRYHGKTLTHESMSMHIPNGESVCIHSVAVQPAYRRQGVASRLLDTFIERVKMRQRDVSRIILICKSYLIPLYTRVGFVLNGKSNIVHGKYPWYELQMNIDNKYLYNGSCG